MAGDALATGSTGTALGARWRVQRPVGMLIVEPAGGLPPVDGVARARAEQWYFDAQGAAPSLARAAVPAAPDWVVFNGISGQYTEAPVPVGADERVRIYLLDAGPALDASFHVAGLVFDGVIRGGRAARPGQPRRLGAGAVDLAPSQGCIVELTMGGDGLYPFGSGAVSLLGRGAQGLFQAGDGDPAS